MTASDWILTILALGLVTFVSWLFNHDDRNGDDVDDF